MSKTNVICFLFSVLILTYQNYAQDFSSDTEFIKGVDVSSLIQIEDNGGVFKENGIVKDPITIFREHNINYIRLKLWHSPSTGYNNLSKVITTAQRIKNKGLRFLLDFHFSDTWADPSTQTKPNAWNSLSFELLKDSVFSYTRNVITKLKNQNVLPDIVHIGNEIICGMLWNDGRICDQYNTTQQWNNFGELIKQAIRGVNESLEPTDTVKIMIHIDRGGDNPGAQWFYDNLIGENVEFDYIGLSFYPWWHGTLSDVQNNLNALAQRYNKEIIIVETAYPWTLEWNDNTNNLVGNTNQLLQGYDATVTGQKKYLNDLMNIIKNVSGKKGKGLFYWEPEWISAPTFGSPWENLALFDFSGELLESISAFDSLLTDINNDKETTHSFSLNQNYPNPFNPSTKIKFTIPQTTSHLHGGESGGLVTLKVYDVLGNEVAALVNETKPAGTYEIEFQSKSGSRQLASGVYYYQLRTGSFVETKKMILMK